MELGDTLPRSDVAFQVPEYSAQKGITEPCRHRLFQVEITVFFKAALQDRRAFRNK